MISTTYPKVTVHLGRLKHNLDSLLAVTQAQGVFVSLVTKVFCADPVIVSLCEKSAVDSFADSRLLNLASLKTYKPRLQLRISQPCEVEDTVRYAELSLQSELLVIKLLAEAAEILKRRHGIILMIDMGDLREGIFYENRAEILDAARFVVENNWLELAGIGVNLTCYGAIVPDQHNLGALVDIADFLRSEISPDLTLPWISGGNSSSLGLLYEGKLPQGINHLRLGESFVLGNDTAACQLIPGLYGDAFVLSAQLAEVKLKPSKPIGTSGANAFGESVFYEDIGMIRRGILAVGRQDIDAQTLKPIDKRVKILGASSDHLLVDLTAAPGYQVGDALDFLPDYGNLLRIFTSPYVRREYCQCADCLDGRAQPTFSC